MTESPVTALSQVINELDKEALTKAYARLLLPPEGTITMKKVIAITDLSRSTIFRKISEGLFPKPFHYGSILLFPVGEIRKFLSNPSEYHS